MIKSFIEFIYEKNGKDESRFIQYSRDIIKCIKDNDSPEGEYIEIRELEYNNEDQFDLVIQIKRESRPNFKTDSHFKSLSWEEINFDQYGFALDASIKIDKQDLIIPEITFTIIIDPTREPYLYTELNYRLIDVITHEIHHTNQIGWNREPFNVRPSSNVSRSKSKKSYKYFLLPDEIESMVKGMYIRSKAQGVSIDKIFDKYLIPFKMNGNISDSEYNQVLTQWVKHTLENYPDAKLSIEDEKIKRIIDQI